MMNYLFRENRQRSPDTEGVRLFQVESGRFTQIRYLKPAKNSSSFSWMMLFLHLPVQGHGASDPLFK